MANSKTNSDVMPFGRSAMLANHSETNSTPNTHHLKQQ